MRVLWLWMAALVWVVGCGQGDEVADPVPDWPGPPVLRPQSLELSYGEEVPGAGEALKPELLETGQIKQALVGDPAVFLGPLRRGLELANRLVWPVLAATREISEEFEPLLASEDVFLWRVEQGDQLLQMVLSRNTERADQWDMVLQLSDVNRRNEPLVPVLSGFFRPGPGYSDELQVGEGVLQFHQNNQLRIPGRELGAVSFRIHEDGRRDLRLVIENDAALDTTMSYVLQPDGSGLFLFATQADVVPRRLSVGEEFVFQATAWLPDRSARTRARVFYRPVGQEGREVMLVDECWGSDLRQSWVAIEPEIVGESDGSVEGCSAGLRGVVLTPPQQGDGSLPDIPGE